MKFRLFAIAAFAVSADKPAAHIADIAASAVMNVGSVMISIRSLIVITSTSSSSSDTK